MTRIMNLSDSRSLSRRISKYLLAPILCGLLSLTAGGGLPQESRRAAGDILIFGVLVTAELPVAVTISSSVDAPLSLIGSIKFVGLTETTALEKPRFPINPYRSEALVQHLRVRT